MANTSIILLERVEKLGNIGDVVSVKPGFARNFLIPQGKALRANEVNKASFEADRARIEQDNADKRTGAEADAEKVKGQQVTMIRQASDSGQLYGSVSARDIAEALSTEDVKITKNQITLAEPIKMLGIHSVDVALHAEVMVQVEANVARSKEEAEMQAQGIDIYAGDEEEDTMTASERAAADALARAEAQAEAELRGEVFEEGAGPAEDGAEGEDAEGEEGETLSTDDISLGEGTAAKPSEVPGEADMAEKAEDAVEEAAKDDADKA